jgi:phage terminase large subunit-like protein
MVKRLDHPREVPAPAEDPFHAELPLEPAGPYLCFPDGKPLNSAEFSIEQYLKDVVPDIRLLDTSEGRRALTEIDPLLFALIYCPGAVRGPETADQITLSDLHLELCRSARSWVMPVTVPKANRTAYIAPRECGKSTWVFKLLPLWAAAHKHRHFIAAFADSATQAREHLSSFRMELENNRKLRADYPELCEPMRRQSGNVLSDSQDDYIASSGFVFKARGIDSAILGMKIGDDRPDLLILDDLEKGESTYSVEQAAKRLETMRSSVLPLSLTAVVVLTGTVNMAGSIMDQLGRAAGGEDVDWVREVNFKIGYFPALMKANDGTDRSLWPAKWPVEWLLYEQETNPRDFAKNFMNQPMSADGGYWEASYFRYGTPDALSFTIMSVDPAVSAKSRSDWTGLAIISYSRSLDRFYIRKAVQLKLGSGPLRERVFRLLEEFPEITTILVESNQGGELWTDVGGVFSDMPPGIKVIVKNQNISKELRAEKAVVEWSKARVFFEQKMPDIERQLMAFPKVTHDDLVDSITAGIIEIRTRVNKARLTPGLVAGKVKYAG